MSEIFKNFLTNAQRNPDRDALIIEGARLSYAELRNNVLRICCELRKRGVKPGDKIGVQLPNCQEFVELMLVAAAMGAALIPLNPGLPPDATALAFKLAGVKHVVALPFPMKALQDKFECMGLRIAVGGASTGGIVDWSFLRNGELQQEMTVESDSYDDHYYIFSMTSGSTGTPKPIVLTQKTKYLRAMAAIALYGVTSDDTVLIATPLYHTLAERLVIMPLITGATMVIMPHFSAAEWLNRVGGDRISFSIAVSSQLKAIARLLSGPSDHNLDSLRCLVSSSALLEPQDKKELIGKLKCDFHECYGTSEIAIATNINFEESRTKVNSVGKAIPGVDVAIVNDAGKFCKPGEPGEIICRTPMLFSGYYQMPEKTRATMSDGYFHTGDVGCLDPEGYLYFLSRKKDIIITGGINVYPPDVEKVVMQADGVEACAAFPVPDAQLGETVGVALVMAVGAHPNIRALRFLCAEQLADYQIPHYFVEVDQLPVNAMGKIVKYKLSEIFIEKRKSAL